ncbi:MAG: HD domain-containing protein [Endomicrobia bacterium]|nr:HD domain-containing protein [Endomicrobiia bacterium]
MQTQSIFSIILSYPEVKIYLEQADKNFKALGYTEQGILHAQHTAHLTQQILSTLNFSKTDIDIAQTAGFLHDIGCAISYKGHPQNGAFIVNRLFDKLSIPQDYKLTVLSIIGSHEDTETLPISELAAAVILADKTDVRRQRVIKTDFKLFDQHDRVHYAVVENNLKINKQQNKIMLELQIDDNICSVVDYFELFISRVDFCKKACGKLGVGFELYINKLKYL